MAQTGILTDVTLNGSSLDGILSAKLPKRSRKDIDVTTLSDDAMRYIPGLPDNNEMELEVLYDQTRYGVYSGVEGVVSPWTVAFDSGNTYSFNGYVKEMEIEAKPDDALVIKVVVKVDGAVTVV